MDKPVTETLRFARLLWLERQEFSRKDAFWGQTSDKVLRYQSAINCQLTKAIDQLEDIQAEQRPHQAHLGPPAARNPLVWPTSMVRFWRKPPRATKSSSLPRCRQTG